MVVFVKIGQNIEFAYEHGVEFFVLLPLLGAVLWTKPEGRQYWTWREVKAQRAAGVL